MFVFIALLLSIITPTFVSYDVEYVDCYDGDTCTFHFILSRTNTDLGMGVEETSTVKLKGQKVRFCDINAPEIRPLSTRAAATSSRDYLRERLKSGKKIVVMVPQKATCNKDVTSCDSKDSFGRWLGYVFIDSENINKTLLEKKLASKFRKTCGLAN